MKKRLITLLIVLVVVILVTFATLILINKHILNKSSEIAMAIKEGTLTRTSVTVSIKDNNNDHVYGYDYSIEKKEDGEWRIVNNIGTYERILLAISPGRAETLNFDIDWSKRYGELDNGEYRIVKSVDTAEGEKLLYAEFTIE